MATGSVSRDRSAGGRELSRALRLGLLLAVLAVGAILRLHDLSAWSLAGDELNTLRDSVRKVGLLGPKPLLFVLNYHLVVPVLGVSELSLRLLPALFGILGIPAAYWAGTRLLDAKVGLAAAALVAANPWHLYWSQFARYYSLVFFLTALFSVALWLGVRRRSVGWIGGGLLLAGLAFLAHPSSALVLGAFVAWLAADAAASLVRERERQRPSLRESVALVLLGIGTIVVGTRVWPVLESWYLREHEWGHQGFTLLLSYGDWVTLPLLVVAAAGLVWMTGSGGRRKAALLGAMIVLPVLLLVAATYLVPVSTAYLFATTPFVFIAAAYLLAELWDSRGTGWRPGVVAVMLMAIVLVDHAPRIVSHYRDGGRLDFRRAAKVLEERADGGDVILSDQERALSYYLPGRTVLPLGKGQTPIVDQLQGELARVADDETSTVWVLADWTRRGGFRDKGLGEATRWVQSRCYLAKSIASSRLDYKLNELRLYRCAASVEGDATAETGETRRIAGQGVG